MNGIKKALSINSHRRSSDDSVEDYNNSTANTTPETSPRNNATQKLAGEKAAHTTPTTSSTGAKTAAANGTAAKTAGTGVPTAAGTKTGTHGSSGLEANDAGLPSKGHSANVDPKALRAAGDGTITESKHHVAHRTEDTRHQHHTEEVFRERDLHHHQNHVQLHAVPIQDQEHQKEKLMDEKRHAVTNIHERHASGAQDAKLLAEVGAHHQKGDMTHAGRQTTEIVDRGEKVNESVHHHVHHVIQPVVQKDTHEYTRSHTHIPTHHEIQHAPVVHQLISHEPVSKDQYLQSGGVLGAKHKDASQIGLLHGGNDNRKVEGVAEKLEQELHLKPGQGKAL